MTEGESSLLPFERRDPLVQQEWLKHRDERIIRELDFLHTLELEESRGVITSAQPIIREIKERLNLK